MRRKFIVQDLVFGTLWLLVVASVVFLVYECIVNKSVRTSMEWRLGWYALAGLVGAGWKWLKPKEKRSATESHLQSGNPEAHRSENRKNQNKGRLQRGR